MSLTPEQYRQDLEFAFSTVMDVHPRPDWRVSMARLEEEMERARSAVGRCRSIHDFWRAAGGFFHAMGDGHTVVLPPPAEQVMILPIVTTLIDGSVLVEEVVDRDAAPGVERGDVIIALDSRDADAVLDDLMATLAFNNGAWGRRQAARRFPAHTAMDGDHAELILGKASGGVTAVELSLLPGDHSSFEVLGRERHRRWYTGCVETSFPDDVRAGLFIYRSCIDRWAAREQNMTADLDGLGITLDDVPDIEETAWSFFTALRNRGYTRLVIDVRGNGGGNSAVGDHLLKYLTRSDIYGYRSDIKISRQMQEQDRGFSDDPPDTIRRFPYEPAAFPYQSRLDEDQLAALQPFDGDLVVLIDSDVYSSGENFVAPLKGNGIGTLVGDPTGGGGSVPGDQLGFTLPNTGLQLRVSYKFFHMPECADQGYPGVLPDYYVRQTLEDYRAGRDTVMEYVRGMWS